MTRRAIGLCSLLLASACGSPSPSSSPTRAERDATEAPIATPSVVHCEPLRAPTFDAHCAAWEQARRAELPNLQDVRCEQGRDHGPVTHGAYTLSVLQILYRVDERSLGERYVLISDGEGWQVVGRLTELFDQSAGALVALRGHELRGAESAPVVVLSGLTRATENLPCLRRETRWTSVVICAELGGGYRCFSEPISQTVSLEVSGSAHPMSSQYDYGMAESCGPVLEEAGFDAEHERRETRSEPRTLRFVRRGVVRFEPSAPIELAARLAAEACFTAY